MQRVIRILFVICVGLVNFSSFAWDVELGVAAPAILGRLPDGVRLTRADVRWDGRKVSILYMGENRSVAHGGFFLSAYAPVYGWQGVAADYPGLHFPEIRLNVNGRSVAHRGLASAYRDGLDVTALLKRSGVSPLLVAQAEPVSAMELPPHVRGLFSASQGNVYPLWQLAYRHQWAVQALAVGSVTFEVIYDGRPQKMEVSLKSKRFASLVQEHCGDLASVTSQLNGMAGRELDSVVAKRLTIPLSFANSAEVDPHLAVVSGVALKGAVTLVCGLQDGSLVGLPDIDLSPVGHGGMLSMLVLYPQS